MTVLIMITVGTLSIAFLCLYNQLSCNEAADFAVKAVECSEDFESAQESIEEIILFVFKADAMYAVVEISAVTGVDNEWRQGNTVTVTVRKGMWKATRNTVVGNAQISTHK